MTWVINISMLFIPGLIAGWFTVGGNPNSAFRDIKLTEAKYDAVAESKQILLYFYSEWCDPCSWMQKNCLDKPEIQSLLDKKFISIKVDLDELEGFELRRQYEIRIMPTVIIIDENGQVLHRAEETMNVKKMTSFLNSIDNNKDSSEQITTVHKANISPMDHIYKVSESNDEKEISSRTEPSNADRRENTERPLGKRSYYLQFGSFTTEDAAIRRKRQLYLMHGIQVNIMESDNGSYRLVGFNSESEDNLYDTMKNLKSENSIDCFVVCL